MQNLNEIRSALSGTLTLQERKDLCRKVGQRIDQLVIEHTDESLTLVREIIAGIKDQTISCLLGAQIHHLIQADHKYGKDHEPHYKKYREHHYRNWQAGILVPTAEQVFL